MARFAARPAAFHRTDAIGRLWAVRRRRLLAVLVALGLAPGTLVRTPEPPPDYAAPLLAERLDVEATRLGPFMLRRAWHLTSANSHFGGYSALLARPDGSLLAGSDAGRLLTIRRGKKGRLTGAFEAFPGAANSDKRDVDLEALTQDGEGNIWAAYEVSNSIARHGGTSDRGIRVRPAEMANWWSNSGPEAMARLSDGRFVVLAEQRSRFGGDSHEGLLFPSDPVAGAEPVVFSVATPDKMRPVDMVEAPGGKVLILLRRFQLFPPQFYVALALGDPGKIAEGKNWPIELIARIEGDAPSENYEGIALSRAGDTGCTVWLISDDNFTAFQRTLLLELAWPECEKAREKPARRSGT